MTAHLLPSSPFVSSMRARDGDCRQEPAWEEDGAVILVDHAVDAFLAVDRRMRSSRSRTIDCDRLRLASVTIDLFCSLSGASNVPPRVRVAEESSARVRYFRKPSYQ